MDGCVRILCIVNILLYSAHYAKRLAEQEQITDGMKVLINKRARKMF